MKFIILSSRTEAKPGRIANHFFSNLGKRYARSILQILPIGNQIFFRIAFAHEMIALEEMNEISR